MIPENMKISATLAALVFISWPAQAGSINWGSEFGSVNVQSDGATPVSSGFTIHLGKFSSGFTPDGTNVDLWASNSRESRHRSGH